MKLREVDPLEPQPGDLVRIYTPIDTEDPDHAMNWDEGVVEANTYDYIEIILSEGGLRSFIHELDEHFQSVYYIVEEA